MCDPVSATIAAVGTALKIGGTVAEASAQNQASNANRESATAALRLKDNELSLRELQEKIAGGQKLEQATRDTTAAAGDTTATAAANGVGGVTVDLLLKDIQAQGSRYADSVNDNTDATVSQLELEKRGAQAEAQSRINSVPRANPFMTALKIGAAGLDLAGQYQASKPKVTK